MGTTSKVRLTGDPTARLTKKVSISTTGDSLPSMGAPTFARDGPHPLNLMPVRIESYDDRLLSYRLFVLVKPKISIAPNLKKCPTNRR